MNTSSNQRKKHFESNNGSLTRSRNVEHYYSRDKEYKGMRPYSKRGRKNESDNNYNYNDDDLFLKNASDSFDKIIINVNDKKSSPAGNKKKLVLSK